jgi:hypothetical protein
MDSRLPFDVLASQWWAGATAACTAEQRLWIAVLRDAVELAGGQRAAHPTTLIEAEEWLASPVTTTGSCGWVCDALGLAQDWVRSQVAAIRHQRMTPGPRPIGGAS